MLESWRAPLGAAITRLTLERLAWPIADARYVVLNGDVSSRWDFGHGGRTGAEVLSDLRAALALDPTLRALVIHGLYDLVTPYFATKLMLDQLPAYGDPARVIFPRCAAATCPTSKRTPAKPCATCQVIF